MLLYSILLLNLPSHDNHPLTKAYPTGPPQSPPRPLASWAVPAVDGGVWQQRTAGPAQFRVLPAAGHGVSLVPCRVYYLAKDLKEAAFGLMHSGTRELDCCSRMNLYSFSGMDQQITHVKFRTICHVWDLWKLARSCKQMCLLCLPDPWNLSGAALLSGFQSSPRALKSTD